MCETETLQRINDGLRGLPRTAALDVLSLTERLSRQQADAANRLLLAFVGLLKASPNFNGDLVAWQREERSVFAYWRTRHELS